MKNQFRMLLTLTVAGVIAVSPAHASRIAIDSRTNPDGTTTPISAFLTGYCDLRPDDFCAGKSLGYGVSFDGGITSFNDVIVHGNGLLTFGQSLDFLTSVGPSDPSFLSQYYQGITPALTDYERTLISAGQNNRIDGLNQTGPAFYQSATLKIVNQTIMAEWYTCAAPATPKSPQACRQNPYSLTLTPTTIGFKGMFDFSQGRGGDDVGYVVNGQQVAVGSSFFLPATITGLAPAVPEPATWAMMIGGFGLIGGVLRRQSSQARVVLG